MCTTIAAKVLHFSAVHFTTYLSQPSLLWLYSHSLVDENSQWTGRCILLLGMYALNEISVPVGFVAMVTRYADSCIVMPLAFTGFPFGSIQFTTGWKCDTTVQLRM